MGPPSCPRRQHHTRLPVSQGVRRGREPTILYDEIDTVFGPRKRKTTRTSANAERRPSAGSNSRSMCRAREDRGDRGTAAYCAVALAGLDDLPDTIMTRSVVVRMRRRAPGRRLNRGATRERSPGRADHRAVSGVVGTGRRRRNRPLADAARGVEDRNADVWEHCCRWPNSPETWPERHVAAAVTLVTASQDRAPSVGVQLLRDYVGSLEVMTVFRPSTF